MFMSRTQSNQQGVANFVQKAFDIISNQEHSSIIEWAPNGKEFAIKDIESFQEVILPRYFRHRNINSFIRQLNMYGFHKSRKEPSKNIFSHPNFQRGRRQLLTNVRRKIKVDEPETPIKPKPILASQLMLKNSEVEETNDKPPKHEASVLNICSLSAFKSFSSNFEHQEPDHPLHSLLVSKSYILDMNYEAGAKRKQNGSPAPQEESDEDDNLSIADEINRERRQFNNRTQGFAIVKTSNFLSEFQL